MFDYYQNKRDEEKRKKKRKRRLLFCLPILLVVLGGLLWFLRSDWFSITRVEIIGVKESLSLDLKGAFYEEIMRKKEPFFGFFKSNNLLSIIFRTKEYEKTLSQAYPILASVNISFSPFKRSIIIKTMEKENFALWCFREEKCWWFDGSGTAFLEGPVSEGELIPKIIAPSPVSIGERVLDADYFSRVKEVFEFLREIGYRRTLYLQPIEFAEVETREKGKPSIYFSLRHNPLFALKAVQGLQGKFPRIQYIDLRAYNRVFYKEN